MSYRLGSRVNSLGTAHSEQRGSSTCGNILTASSDGDADAIALSRAIAEEFDIVGVNGVDFVSRGGRAFALEVNPRWSASMELVELAYGLSVFGAHAGACAHGALPAFDLEEARRKTPGTVGKAVVFARRDVVVGDTSSWLPTVPLPELPPLRDVPRAGERIAAGSPVCTVFARANDVAECHAALVERARQVYAALAAWEREVA